MPTPQILADIVRLLIQLLPAMALVCLVLAGIALRLEGGSTFSIGGSFTRWMLWSVIMVTLPQLLLWFSFFVLPVPSSPGANWNELALGNPERCVNFAGKHRAPNFALMGVSNEYNRRVF